jgi:holo-[acyl-carrier protein] synthase
LKLPYEFPRNKVVNVVLGIGIDTVDVVSFRNRLDGRLVDELFLPAEIDYCRSQVRSWENFAARFAAKEAAFKAIGRGLASGIRFLDVEIVRNTDTGAVSLKLHGKALFFQKSLGIQSLHVSISHTKNNAVAIVVAEGEPV